MFITLEALRKLLFCLTILYSSGSGQPDRPIPQKEYDAWLYARQAVVTCRVIINKPESQAELENMGIKDYINSQLAVALKWRYPQTGMTRDQGKAVWDVCSTTFGLIQKMPHLQRPLLSPRTSPAPDVVNGPILVP